MQNIIYTKVDEAPALATYSFLPIVKTFTKSSNINIVTKNISLAHRILASFPEYLKKEQIVVDDLKYLEKMIQNKEANIIKLPNISASIPQLKAAIKELREKNFMVPLYDENEQTKKKYKQILGSAVNPILREGNSDRRAPKAVKNYAKKHPHLMKNWDKNSKTNVISMKKNDFYETETSKTLSENDNYKIIFTDKNNNKTIWKDSLPLLKGEIIDASYMDSNYLEKFYTEAINKAKNENLLLSLHLKATMMKISDPIIFGFALKVFFKDLINKYNNIFKKLEINFNNGLGDLYTKINSLDSKLKNQILDDINKIFAQQPDVAMVNSKKNITNFHVPSDVIIDASMPSMIKNGGKMWDKNNKCQDTLAMIPDRSYAGVYQAVIDDCKLNGSLNPSTLGSVQNVGLMAKKAEEYGSHDKTFQAKEDGEVSIINKDNKIIFSFKLNKNDIFRMCQTKDEAIKNWVKLAVDRASESNTPAVFWLDDNRAHDLEIKNKVTKYLKEYDLSNLNISIKSPSEATKFSLIRMRKGLDTISVTGNILRDYNTDLFPIIEVGTSAKMLSIVPLLNGGGLFETGAGGSAPKHVQQFLKENYLRWDSLGEFLALSASLNFLGNKNNNKKAKVLAKTLDKACEDYLDNNKSPARKIGDIDNRGSQFYLTLYWATNLSNQDTDKDLKKEFSPIAKALKENEKKIILELNKNQGNPVDIKGYYLPDDNIANIFLRPSKTFNCIIKKEYFK